MDHSYWNLLKQPNSPSERALAHAVAMLSLTAYPNKTFQEIYDFVMGNAPIEANFNVSTALMDQLARMEKIMSGVSSAVQRLQSDDVAIQKVLADIQTAQANMLQAQADAESRLEADIASLRNAAGSGDPDAINAVADSLEKTQAAFSAIRDQMNAVTQTQVAVDPAPAPQPVPLTISPSTVSMLRTATQQFSVNIAGSTFSANNGSIDTSGLYTPPTDATILSDTVTAKSPDGTQQVVASISISG